ncbi:MAG: type II toxin-antitoxin system PemK/MazF family toxin [Clostridia bacterium]|nr:type II toxin-antitoxin system PemK/MazF family toxin [Clostridia bacterium]
MNIRRGDIYYADLSPVVGSEQGGLRPVLIVQNDVGNKHSPTVIAAAITSKMTKAKLPTHIGIFGEKVGLSKDSVILLEQIRTIDKTRLKEKMGHLDDDIMSSVNNAITVSFGLNTYMASQESAPQIQYTPTAYEGISAVITDKNIVT